MISRVRLSKSLLTLIIFLSFNFGLIELIGVNGFIISLGIDLALLLFIINGVLMKPTGQFINKYLVLLFIIMMISLTINDTGILLFIIFCKKFLIIFLITPLIIKTFRSDSNYFSSNFNVFFVVICFLQIVAGSVKIFINGFSEDYIGTMSTNNGSLAVLFPLLFLAFNYHRFKQLNSRVLLYSVLALIIPISSLKRAIIFILPILLLYISNLHGKLAYKLKQIIFSLVGIIILLSLSLNFNDKFNNEIGGEIDLVKIVETYLDYESREGENDGVVVSGRLSSFSLIQENFSLRGVESLLFGLGPGFMIKSRLVEGQEDILNSKLNLGYGSRIGVYWIFFQIGILGLILYFISFYNLLNFKKNESRINKDLKKIIFFILFFDMFYSSTLLENYTGIVFLSLLIAISNLTSEKLNTPSHEK